MDLLHVPTVSAVGAVSGLFVSDRFAAQSVFNIKSHNIVRILSLVPPEEVPRFDRSEGKQDVAVEIRNINIDDDPMEDILMHLKDACDWIQSGLDQRSADGSNGQTGVLVHRQQGISRSGSFIVAYLMRKFQLPYSDALSLARVLRPIICPNKGFEDQLRVWEQCRYDIHAGGHTDSAETKKTKAPYEAWKAKRDNTFKKSVEGINKNRASSVARLAAHVGKRRHAEENLDREGSLGGQREA
ncbi:hypothetical protein AJ79_06765 [Helicocarpus griseus UAMH5409]|uniref:protein-tyrosine-phosphatase n=1 Tax=Helicocarpus griseus UAMH5409 TaxID=1447875 RepID=A0A2B7XAC4_9EURO|nr:hypothetical protein AJ79_06765 [Helicocarpus griseus UAMH5409]